MFIFDYFGRVCLLTIVQLALVFGPALLFGVVTHFLSARIRRYLCSKFLVYFTAPGTVVHETGHALGFLMFGIGIAKFVPFHPDKKTGLLGYVQSKPYDDTKFFKRVGTFVAGTGPIWFGSAVVVLMAFVLLGKETMMELGLTVPAEQNFQTLADFGQYVADIFITALTFLGKLFSSKLLLNPLTYIFVYLTYCICLHMELSDLDLKMCFGSGLGAIVPAVFIFNLATAWLGDFSMNFTYWLTQYNHIVYSLWAFVLLIMLVIELCTIIYEKYRSSRRR